jgi:GAF domain-containing protein
MRSQAVNGAAPAAPGAIAVPIVTASGCVGVLSAEVSRTRPDHETLAVARMIAAQFAAIVSPASGVEIREPRTAQV